MRNLFLGLFLVLTACTNNSSITSSNNPEGKSPSFEYDISKAQLQNNIVTSPDPLVFGITTPASQVVTAVLTIKNSGTSSTPVPLTTSMVAENGFSIKTNRCGTSLAKAATCQITIQFSARGLFDGDQHSSLQVNESEIPLVATVSGQIDPDSANGTPHLKLSLNLPFDPLGSTPSRTLTILNDGTGTASNFVATIPSDYTISVNRCSSTLKPGKSCTMQVFLTNYRTNPVPPPIVVSVTVPNQPTATASLDLKNNTVPPPVSSITHKLTLNKIGFGSVSGNQISCGQDCDKVEVTYAEGSTVTLTATPKIGGSIYAWSDAGASCGSNSICPITMSSDKTVIVKLKSSDVEPSLVKNIHSGTKGYIIGPDNIAVNPSNNYSMIFLGYDGTAVNVYSSNGNPTDPIKIISNVSPGSTGDYSVNLPKISSVGSYVYVKTSQSLWQINGPSVTQLSSSLYGQSVLYGSGGVYFVSTSYGVQNPDTENYENRIDLINQFNGLIYSKYFSDDHDVQILDLRDQNVGPNGLIPVIVLEDNYQGEITTTVINTLTKNEMLSVSNGEISLLGSENSPMVAYGYSDDLGQFSYRITSDDQIQEVIDPGSGMPIDEYAKVVGDYILQPSYSGVSKLDVDGNFTPIYIDPFSSMSQMLSNGKENFLTCQVELSQKSEGPCYIITQDFVGVDEEILPVAKRLSADGGIDTLGQVPDSSLLKAITAAADGLMGIYKDPISGMELFKVGVAQPFAIVKDILPGAAGAFDSQLSSQSSQFIPLLKSSGSKAFFIANDGTNGNEMWVSDGYSAGTSLLKDINTKGEDGLKITPTYYFSNIAKLNNQYYFGGNSASGGEELWSTNGTLAGTAQVGDINPGASDSLITGITVFQNKLVFGATGADGKTGLWTNSGSGPSVLISSGSNPNGILDTSRVNEYYSIAGLKDYVSFIGILSNGNKSPMVSNGVTVTTVSNVSGKIPSPSTYANMISGVSNTNTAYVTATVGSKSSIFMIDATTAEMSFVMDADQNNQILRSDLTITTDDYFYFFASVNNIKSVYRHKKGISPELVTTFAGGATGAYYFVADKNGSSTDLYFITNGSPFTIIKVNEQTKVSSVITSPVPVAGKIAILGGHNMCYSSYVSNTSKINCSNGNVYTFPAGFNISGRGLIADPSGKGTKAYFYPAQDTTAGMGVEVWEYDSVSNTAKRLKNISSISSPSVVPSITLLKVDGDKLIFAEDDGTNGVELYSYDP